MNTYPIMIHVICALVENHESHLFQFKSSLAFLGGWVYVVCIYDLNRSAKFLFKVKRGGRVFNYFKYKK